jgi:hypothetical protein
MLDTYRARRAARRAERREAQYLWVMLRLDAAYARGRISLDTYRWLRSQAVDAFR